MNKDLGAQLQEQMKGAGLTVKDFPKQTQSEPRTQRPKHNGSRARNETKSPGKAIADQHRDAKHNNSGDRGNRPNPKKRVIDPVDVDHTKVDLGVRALTAADLDRIAIEHAGVVGAVLPTDGLKIDFSLSKQILAGGWEAVWVNAPYTGEFGTLVIRSTDVRTHKLIRTGCARKWMSYGLTERQAYRLWEFREKKKHDVAEQVGSIMKNPELTQRWLTHPNATSPTADRGDWTMNNSDIVKLVIDEDEKAIARIVHHLSQPDKPTSRKHPRPNQKSEPTPAVSTPSGKPAKKTQQKKTFNKRVYIKTETQVEVLDVPVDNAVEAVVDAPVNPEVIPVVDVTEMAFIEELKLHSERHASGDVDASETATELST